MTSLRAFGWIVALPFVGACSFCDTPLVCADDANCPAPQRCVDELCAIAALDDAGPSGEGEGEGEGEGGEGEGEAGEGEGEAGEGEGEGGEGEGEGGEGEGEGGEGEGEPVDAGPECSGTETFCQAALCDGLVDAVGHATLDFAGVLATSFCFENDAKVWTLVAKVDGDDSGLLFNSTDEGGWDALLRKAEETFDNRDFDAGENALLHGYAGIAATELLVGFNSLSVGDNGAPPAVLIPVLVPGAPRSVKDLVDSDESYVADATEVALWLSALSPAEANEVAPDFSDASNACVAFGKSVGGFGVRLGLLNDCAAPTAYIGLGGRGCDRDGPPEFPDITTGEPSAGACELQAPGDSNIMVRVGYILAR